MYVYFWKMFAGGKPLRGKKFQPRVPREELLAETYEVLREKGADHHSQAKLMLYLAKEIYRSKNPMFVPLRAKPKNRQTKAWIQAYTIVFAFLNDNKMDFAKEVLLLELGKMKLPEDPQLLKKMHVTKYLNALLRFKPDPEENSFAERVGIFRIQARLANIKPQRQIKQVPKYVSPPSSKQPSASSSFIQKSSPPKPQPAPVPKPTPKESYSKPDFPSPPAVSKQPIRQETTQKRPPQVQIQQKPVTQQKLPSPIPMKKPATPFVKPTVNNIKEVPNNFTLNSEILEDPSHPQQSHISFNEDFSTGFESEIPTVTASANTKPPVNNSPKNSAHSSSIQVSSNLQQSSNGQTDGESEYNIEYESTLGTRSQLESKEESINEEFDFIEDVNGNSKSIPKSGIETDVIISDFSETGTTQASVEEPSTNEADAIISDFDGDASTDKKYEAEVVEDGSIVEDIESFDSEGIVEEFDD